MTPTETTSRENAQLFFRAACCMISADGKVRSEELSLLSQAMTRLGHPHTPEQLRTLAIATCKDVHSKGVDAESEQLASQLLRFRGTPWAPFFHQVFCELVASDASIGNRERLIASRLCQSLSGVGTSVPPFSSGSTDIRQGGPAVNDDHMTRPSARLGNQAAEATENSWQLQQHVAKTVGAIVAVCAVVVAVVFCVYKSRGYQHQQKQPSAAEALAVTETAARAQDPLASPESVVKAYYSVPEAQWRNIIPLVSDAEKAMPLMAKWYGEREGSTSTYIVSGVSGAVDPQLYSALGDSHKVLVSFPLVRGGTVTEPLTVVRTAKGFQVDWLQSNKADLLKKGWWTGGRLSQGDFTEIMIKHLAGVGERYVNKPVRMLTVEYRGISNSWITNIPGVMVDSNGLVTTYNKKAAEAWVGFMIKDREHELGFKFFAPKEKWADVLLEMKEGQLLNLEGVVTEMKGLQDYGVLVYDIEVLRP
jgi:hypothetical protein